MTVMPRFRATDTTRFELCPWMSATISIVLLQATSMAFGADAEFFERQVRPVLATRCYSCHGSDKQFGNLRLDSRDRILRGGNTGPAAVAGKPADSLLIK